MDLNIDDYVSGGYFVTQLFDRPERMSVDLLPGQILSVSRCLAAILPDSWNLSWVRTSEEERYCAAAKFGLSPETTAELVEWVTERFDRNEVGFPGIFNSIETARALLERFPLPKNCLLLGLGLHKQFVAEFKAVEAVVPGVGNGGVWQCVSAEQALADGFLIEGYEILGYDYGDFHSWLCNGLEVDADRLFGIRPAKHGLLARLDQADMVTEYVRRDETGAEPGLWLPWLVVRYA